MILKYLFTRSEIRGTLVLTVVVVGIRFLIFAIDTGNTAPDTPAGDSVANSLSQQVKKKPEKIEVNSADTVKLLDLNGIGPAYARRIVKYRDALGGFASLGQLREVYGMDSARYSGFINQVKLDTSQLKRLDVNRATFKELLAHPYLDYEQVKAVCRFREKKGRLSSPGELWAAGVLPDSIRTRLGHYLFAGKDSVQKDRPRFVK
jgi:DNA uptake protein ComE-like DNA-binding protein